MACGVLGGAFNPPHIGHLVLAQEAVAQLGLRHVHLVPTGRAPHKEIAADPGMATRLELTRTAAAENEDLRVTSVEIDAASEGEGPSYTVETLEKLAGEGEELVLLMGADVAARLETWHEPERVVELARVGVANRPGVAVDDAEAALERLGAADRMDLIDMPALEVSSTEIRRRVAAGLPVRYLVTDGVGELIETGRLYQG